MVYIGFDVETANSKAGSICSIGLAKLVNGKVVDSRDWLVHPHRCMNWMSKFCYQVHGICLDSLQDEPEFDQLWPDFIQFVESGDLVVMHNASFDLRQLQAVLALYDLAPIRFPYIDSLQVSRRCLQGLDNYKLNTVADELGIRFQHHYAYDDAATCAKILSLLDWKKEWVHYFPR